MKSTSVTSNHHFRLILQLTVWILVQLLPLKVIADPLTVNPSSFDPRGGEVSLEYQLARQSVVNVQVLDVRGVVVKVLVNQAVQPPGTQKVAWDGTDRSGSAVKEGRYQFRVEIKEMGNTGSQVMRAAFSVVYPAPQILAVKSSVSDDTSNIYPVGSMVRIDVDTQLNLRAIARGTVRITSASTGYDSGQQALELANPINFRWNTLGLKPAKDYKVSVSLTDTRGKVA